jgi:hypothetical protein
MLRFVCNDQLEKQQQLFFVQNRNEGVNLWQCLFDDTGVLKRGDDHEEHLSVDVVLLFELLFELFTKGLFSEVKKVLDDFLLFLHKLIVLAF